jgi:predicted transcriptional regulator
MDLTQKEKDLLTLLAKEWEDTGPPGYVETTHIAARLNVPVEEAKAIIRSLFVKGIVDTDEVDTFAAYLTPEGYELAGKK